MIRRDALVAAVLLAVPVLPAAAEEPKRSAVWESNCMVCHGADGRAETEEGRKKKARNLADARWQASVSDDRLLRSIRRGHEEMPAFGRKLSEEQTKALLAEVRSLAAKK
jgi:mono/diheme cytochrome c family protein